MICTVLSPKSLSPHPLSILLNYNSRKLLFVDFLKHSYKKQKLYLPGVRGHPNSLPYLSHNWKRFLPQSDMLKITEQFANSVDPDQTLHSAVSDLGLHCVFSGLFVLTLRVKYWLTA